MTSIEKTKAIRAAMKGHGALSISCNVQMHLNNHAGTTQK